MLSIDAFAENCVAVQKFSLKYSYEWLKIREICEIKTRKSLINGTLMTLSRVFPRPLPDFISQLLHLGMKLT